MYLVLHIVSSFFVVFSVKMHFILLPIKVLCYKLHKIITSGNAELVSFSSTKETLQIMLQRLYSWPKHSIDVIHVKIGF